MRGRSLRLFRTVAPALLVASAFAPVSGTLPAESVARTGGRIDPSDLEAFIDGILAAQLNSGAVVGATLAVVENGDPLLVKGYGHSDLARRKKVDPRATLFRIASTSKLFTFTAVMQLVERGELDLEVDVDNYLTTFEIPDTFPEPITVGHLLTHTAGFEDTMMQLFRSSDPAESLGDALAKSLPARVRPPGMFSVYSNYAVSLAGHLVEQVSGLPFAQYIEENIQRPLGMDHATFVEPAPTEDLALGYVLGDGGFEPQDFEYDHTPAGGMSASAAAMSRFMIAHLQDGRFGDARILEEVTARRMHERLFAHDPRLPGMAHGFYESVVNGERILGHAGDKGAFHTDLHLLPQHGIGLFVSYNSSGGASAREQLWHAFMDRYFPAQEAAPIEPPAGFQERGGRFAGKYAALRRPYTTFGKPIRFFATVSIDVTADGYLRLSALGSAQRFVEAGPLLFREVDGTEMLAFREDDDGNVTHAFIGSQPFMATERLAWWQDGVLHMVLAGASILLLLSWPVAVYRSRGNAGDGSRGELLASRAATVASALFVLFPIASGIVLFAVGVEKISMCGVPTSLIAVLFLPIAASLLTVGTAVFAVLCWKNGYWSLKGRIHFTLLSLASLLFVALLAYWNLLGFHF